MGWTRHLHPGSGTRNPGHCDGIAPCAREQRTQVAPAWQRRCESDSDCRDVCFILSAVTARIRSQQQVLVLSLVVALLLFAAVVRWLAQRLRYFEGIEVYSGRDLGFAIFSGIMLMFAQGCFFYQIVPYFDQVQKVDSLEFALRMAPYLVGLLAGCLLVARLALRFGARRILMFSFIMLGLAMLGLSQLEVDSPFWVMLVPITLIGLSGGLGGPARTAVVMSSPPQGLVTVPLPLTRRPGKPVMCSA